MLQSFDVYSKYHKGTSIKYIIKEIFLSTRKYIYNTIERWFAGPKT